jgi:hypothetical protein
MATVPAFPKKEFFRQMFTRDISLEDCILDLVDNSIDSLIRTQNIDISASVEALGPAQFPPRESLPDVKITLSTEQVVITDACGGISRADAEDHVFSFGSVPGQSNTTLGVYGIGMKRAMFKIGNTFSIESRQAPNGFRVFLEDVEAWSKKDDTLEQWRIPIESLADAANGRPGVTITITNLHEEVKTRLQDGGIEGNLRQAVSQTYCMFLDRFVAVSLNDKPVPPNLIPIAESEDIPPSIDKFESHGVRVTIIAGLAPKRSWSYEKAGWYVLCNGRVVVSADKSDLTTWGPPRPIFQNKFNGFVGIAFFQSKDPLLLPWTTAKRGLNRESAVYQLARNKMAGVAGPFLQFLSGMYPSDLQERPQQRVLSEKLKPADLTSLIVRDPVTFAGLKPAKQPKKRTVRIAYDADVHLVERVKKHLRRPSMSNPDVGRHTFDHYIRRECPE